MTGGTYDFDGLKRIISTADMHTLHQYLLHPLPHGDYESFGMNALSELGIRIPGEHNDTEVFEVIFETFLMRLFKMKKSDPSLRAIVLTSIMTMENVKGLNSDCAPSYWMTVPCKILSMVSHYLSPAMKSRLDFILDGHAEQLHNTLNSEMVSHGANNGVLFYLNSQLALNHPYMFYEVCNSNIRKMIDQVDLVCIPPSV